MTNFVVAVNTGLRQHVLYFTVPDHIPGEPIDKARHALQNWCVDNRVKIDYDKHTVTWAQLPSDTPPLDSERILKELGWS